MNKKLAIVVPYTEDRKEQMFTFVGHMEYFLKDKVDYEIHFIRQRMNNQIDFNYGKLCNVGFDIVSNESDYVIFHDVDILPKQEICDYTYSHYPTHLCPNLKPYPNWIGGAFKIKNEDFIIANGFSNDYWGGVFHWEDFLFRLDKKNLLPSKRYYTKDIRKPHRLIDIGEVAKYSEKIVYPFESSETNCALIKSNKNTDYLFEDSFTISMNIWIDDDQKENGCIIGKQGYDMGIFIMKNEAIAVQVWSDESELFQIWYPHKAYCNQWINLTLRVDMDKERISLCIDGKEVAHTSTPGILMDYRGKDIWIGSMAFKNSFKGKISNMLAFDYALSDSEIEKIYMDGYKDGDIISTNFEALIDIPFNKKFGEFYVDESKSRANARIISTGLHTKIYSEKITLSNETNMPEQSIGRFEIMKDADKFWKLGNYTWNEKDESFIENENMFFYEIATKVLNTDKFGLNTLKYELDKTENIKDKIFIHTITL
jgi:hypothetical protein